MMVDGKSSEIKQTFGGIWAVPDDGKTMMLDISLILRDASSLKSLSMRDDGDLEVVVSMEAVKPLLASPSDLKLWQYDI